MGFARHPESRSFVEGGDLTRTICYGGDFIFEILAIQRIDCIKITENFRKSLIKNKKLIN